ncbi:MAG: virulence RhuM family protein [Firmicutes bacterium]|nr:virulence RhuM family protein [Bacillota bacterium]
MYKSEIIIFQTEDGQTKIEVVFDGDTVWLTQDKIAELFQKSRSTITEHINNIFADGELEESEVKTSVGNPDGSLKHRPPKLFNLDMILAVGYRVKSNRGIHFRKWASSVLKEYMRKGFAINDELLKNAGGGTYFKELLSRIRDIRSSEKVFYRQVLDLFATSVDYDSKSEIAIEFFKKMQNKLLFAVSEKTAAELISSRANAELPFMGLKAFKGDKPKKHEVTVSKNYLTESEIVDLNLTVSAYLDIAERKAIRQEIMHMADWAKELERFIVYQKMPVLKGAGKVSHEDATEKAETEYAKYKQKTKDELTQVEKDFLETIHRTYQLLEGKKPK